MKHQACASRQLASTVSADISTRNHANRTHEAQDLSAAQGLHVRQEVAIPSGESSAQTPLQVNSVSDQSQSESSLVVKSTAGVTGTDAPDNSEQSFAEESTHFHGTDKDGDRPGDDPELVPVTDIWSDNNTIQYLQDNRVYRRHTSPKERDRIWRKAQSCRFENHTRVKVTNDGMPKRVPPPEARAELVHNIHRQLGHFGVKRTYSLLEPTFWWAGMHEQVAKLVASCQVCDRVKASFNVKDSVLKPLPIMGLGYRWSCDLAGPLPPSKTGFLYVMVMIEHFSKWIELVPLVDNTSEETAKAFL